MTRLAVRGVFAFCLANLVCWPVLPAYVQAVAPVAAGLWDLLAPHGQTLTVIEVTPRLRWLWEPLGEAGQLPARLLTYNVVLYITALAIVPDLSWRSRLHWLPIGLGLLFLWHVADLLLTAESQLLTHTRPDSYDLGRQFDPLFLGVKLANNLNALGLRQVVPLLLAGAQWLWWHRRPG